MKQFVVSSIVLALIILGWGDHALNWAFITFNVFEHLVEFEPDGTLVPRLAAGWH
jgi:hypothetical protein